MLGYVAVTDVVWFRFLGDRPDLDEVNFWRPSDMADGKLFPKQLMQTRWVCFHGSWPWICVVARAMAERGAESGRNHG